YVWKDIPNDLIHTDYSPASYVTPEETATKVREKGEILAAPVITRRTPAPLPPQRLIDEIIARNVVPVIGAGISIATKMEGEINPPMPSYIQLLQLLLQRVKDRGETAYTIKRIQDAMSEGDTRSAARDIEEKLGNGFFRELRAILNPIDEKMQPSPAHNFLRTLNFSQIITTNYDRLIEKFIAPRHEVITPVDSGSFGFFEEGL